MNDEQRESINAFNDGQLDEVQTENVKRLLTRDPAARAYLEDIERLDQVLGNAFEPVMREPMPAGLVAVLKRRRRRPSRQLLVPLALAASVLLAGVLLVRQDALEQQLKMQQQLLQMSQEISALRHQALENIASGEVASWVAPVGQTRAEVRPLKTYRTADKGFCREYEERVEDARGVEIRRGIACRAGKGIWSDLAGSSSGDPAPQVRL
jgi:anti-sigma factor RsiW